MYMASWRSDIHILPGQLTTQIGGLAMRQAIKFDAIKRNRTLNQRSMSGAVIAEGAAAAVMLTVLGVGLLLLILNTVILGDASYKLTVVASGAARNIDAAKFWLGMKRDDYDPAKAQSNARALADSMLDAVGLPRTTDFKVTETQSNIGGTKTTISVVRLTVGGLKTAGGFFPPFVQLSGSGVSCDNAVPPYGVGLLFLVEPTDDRNNQAIFFPIYAAVRHASRPGGDVNPIMGFSPNRSPFLHLGEFTGPHPIASHLILRQAGDRGYPDGNFRINGPDGSPNQW